MSEIGAGLQVDASRCRGGQRGQMRTLHLPGRTLVSGSYSESLTKGQKFNRPCSSNTLPYRRAPRFPAPARACPRHVD